MNSNSSSNSMHRQLYGVRSPRDQCFLVQCDGERHAPLLFAHPADADAWARGFAGPSAPDELEVVALAPTDLALINLACARLDSRPHAAPSSPAPNAGGADAPAAFEFRVSPDGAHAAPTTPPPSRWTEDADGTRRLVAAILNSNDERQAESRDRARRLRSRDRARRRAARRRNSLARHTALLLLSVGLLFAAWVLMATRSGAHAGFAAGMLTVAGFFTLLMAERQLRERERGR